MKVEFTSQSGRDGVNPSAQTGRLINLFREPLVAGAKAGYQLRAVSGMAQIADLDRVFMRDLRVFNGNLLSLCGGMLSRITANGVVTEIGEVGESEASNLSENTGYATIVADGSYHHWDGADLVPVALDYPVGSVGYLGGYTIVTELGGRRFGWSDLRDPTTFPGLNFASAEIDNNPILRGVVCKDVLLLFKTSGFEMWAVSGQAGAKAFARVSGAMEEKGLRAFGLITTFPNGLAFVGSDGKVYLWSGGLSPISITPVESALERNEPQRMFYYTKRGHEFICITFRDIPAWCCDLSTGEWHERAENDGPWTMETTTGFGGAWYGGTQTGKIVRLTDRCVDFGMPMIRKAVSLPLSKGKPFIVSAIAIYPQTGTHQQSDAEYWLEDDVGVLSGDGLNPLAWADDSPASIGLRVTRDGQSFGPERVRGLGAPGQRDLWVQWRNLGQFRRMGAFELTLSSTVDVPLLSAAEVELR